MEPPVVDSIPQHSQDRQDTSADELPLLPHHLAQLAEGSGIALDIIKARGYRSIMRKSDLTTLGFTRQQLRVPALLLPVWTVAGEIGNYQIRPDVPRIQSKTGKTIKYETVARSRMVVDVPPAARPWLADPSRPVWLTEGIKKGDALAARGCAVIALLGVWNWRGTNEHGGQTVLTDFEAVALKGRQVYLVFDSDVMVKWEVHQALARFGAWLTSRGAQVAYVYLPGAAGGAKQGVDDYVVGGGTVDGLIALATTELRALPADEGKAASGPPADDKPGASLIARELADDWHDKVIYETTRRRWMVWGFNVEGIGRWWELTEEQILARIARDLTKRLPGGFSWHFLHGMERLVRLHLQRHLKPPSRDYLPFRNGALHLPTMTLEEHTPERGFTWCLPYEYDPQATCEPILAWMRQAQDETQDGVDDRVRLLLAYLNAILKRRTDLQRFLEAIGPGGSGKGTYAKLAMGLVGCENAHVTTLQRLETNRFETAEILGKRLVLITDAEAYAGSVAILKALVGADPLPGERKYAIESRHFIPEALVIVATNEAVQSADYTSGLQRRRLSLPFPYTPDVPRCLLDFDGEVAVGEFAPYLAGLVNEALTIPDDEVTALIRHTPLVIPSLRDAWRRSMAETNPLAAWADEQLVLDPGAQTYIGKAERDSRTGRFAHTNDWLYPSYRADCDGAGVSKPVSLQRFRRLLMDFCQRQLKLQGLADGKDVGGAYVLGLRLRCVTEGGRGLMDQTLVADGVDASDELFNKYKEEQGNTIVPIGGDEQGAPPLMPYNGTPPENPSEPSTLSVARVSGRQLTAHIHQHRHQRPTNGTGQRSRSQGGRDWPYPRPRNDRWRR